MPRRNAATLLGGREGADAWKETRRRCRYCPRSFLPVRQKQAFCPGGACRRAWWQERGLRDRPHKCRCGKLHDPHPEKCRRPECRGFLMRGEDGEARCLLCGRGSERRQWGAKGTQGHA